MNRSVEIANIRWNLTENLPVDVLFGPEGLRLPEWLQGGRASPVKQGTHRGVWRVSLPELDFHLKHDHPAGRNSWLRSFFRPSAARIEFKRALALAKRGVQTPEPLAFGDGRGSSYLITRTVPDTEPLNAFLERTLPTLPLLRQTRIRQRLAETLGRFLAQLHDAGVTHHDLHPGNLLLRRDHDDEPRLWLIDLHAVRLGKPLDWAASQANLVMLNRYFMLRCERTDRLRCWGAYCSARRFLGASPERTQHMLPGFAAPDRMDERARGRQIELSTLASNLCFWRVRDRRCLGSNRYFRRVQNSDVVGQMVADLPVDVLAPFLANPDAPFQFADAKILKDSPSSTVAELSLRGPNGPRAVIWKRFAVTTWTDPWTALARPTAALRSWIMGHALQTRFLPTPRPLAVLHRQKYGLFREGYLLTEKAPNSIDLAAYVERFATSKDRTGLRELRGVIARVARLVRLLHQRHISHRDLKAANLLLSLGDSDEINEIFFIDLVGVRRYHKLRRSRRVQNLARLHASFREHPALTRSDKVRFLRAYLAWGLYGKSGWKRWWSQIETATTAKVRRNQRNGRPLK